jgi:hypothetical protein
MLVCQLMVLVLTAVKRFDAVRRHAWQSLREVLGIALGSRAERGRARFVSRALRQGTTPVVPLGSFL